MFIHNVNRNVMHQFLEQVIFTHHSLYSVVVLLQRECRSDITCSFPDPAPLFFLLDERAGLGQN